MSFMSSSLDRAQTLCLLVCTVTVAVNSFQLGIGNLRAEHEASVTTKVGLAARVFDKRLEKVSGHRDDHRDGAHRLTLADAPTAEPLKNLQWLHFPKTGTSFIATLWGYACGQGAAPIDLAVDSNSRHGCGQCYDQALMERYPEDKYCTPGVLAHNFEPQHSPVTLTVVEKQKVVGLFRRPSQRLISAYYDHLHASGFSQETYGLLRDACDGETVAAYANFPGVAGCTARMLTGGHCTEDPKERSAPEFDGGNSRVALAIEAVEKMAFVGLTEEWDESVCLFHKMFGGGVYEDEFKNIHHGLESNPSTDYSEDDLDGFVDEADEQIYAAAQKRFAELRRTYGGATDGDNATSVCASLLDKRGASLSETTDTGGERCSALGQECGVVGVGGLDCGVCPSGRLTFQNPSGLLEGSLARTLEIATETSDLRCNKKGQCLLAGKPAPELFEWHMSS